MAKKNDAKQSDVVRGLLFEYDSVFARFENIVLKNHALNESINIQKLKDAYQVFFGAIRVLEAQEKVADA